MDTFRQVQEEFENWIQELSCLRMDDGREAYSIVYGLVTVGVFLMWKKNLEEYRSDLMGIHGTDWFTLDREKWSTAKKAIYSHVDFAA